MAAHRRRRAGGTLLDAPPPPTKVPIVGKKEIYHWNIWSDQFWYTNFWVPDPPPF